MNNKKIKSDCMENGENQGASAARAGGGPGYPLQVLSAALRRFRSIRFYPLREKAPGGEGRPFDLTREDKNRSGDRLREKAPGGRGRPFDLTRKDKNRSSDRLREKTPGFHVLCACAALLAACAPKAELSAPPPDGGMRDTLMAILWQQQSGEYAALCYQAFNAGKAFIRAEAAGGKSAAVLDIDETVLDNSPYAAYLIQEDAPWSEESWERWCDAAAAQAIPGALDFCRFLAERGIEIFYISNRPEAALDGTAANLQALGFPNARTERIFLQSGTSDKTPRLNKVREEGYTIVLFAGDNLDDFDGSIRKRGSAERRAWAKENAESFGFRRLVLPNSVYGTFEAALAEGYYGKSPAERAAVRLGLLQSWK